MFRKIVIGLGYLAIFCSIVGLVGSFFPVAPMLIKIMMPAGMFLFVIAGFLSGFLTSKSDEKPRLSEKTLTILSYISIGFIIIGVIAGFTPYDSISTNFFPLGLIMLLFVGQNYSKDDDVDEENVKKVKTVDDKKSELIAHLFWTIIILCLGIQAIPYFLLPFAAFTVKLIIVGSAILIMLNLYQLFKIMRKPNGNNIGNNDSSQ